MNQAEEAQEAVLFSGLSQLLEVLGWVQTIVARGKGLQQVHLSFLRHAAAKKRVSFDRIGHDGMLPRYAVSRAAALLQKRRLGTIRADKADKRWHRFHINRAGVDLIASIDLEIANMTIRLVHAASRDSKRYYNFALHLTNLVGLLPDVGVAGYFFPSNIGQDERVSAEDMERFEQALAADPEFPGTLRLYRDIYALD